MKSNIMKILVITALIIFAGAGASLADGDRGHHRGHTYGHCKHRVHHHYHCAPPRPVYVERHYYPAPTYYAAPAPSGFFFGMSVAVNGKRNTGMDPAR